MSPIIIKTPIKMAIVALATFSLSWTMQARRVLLVLERTSRMGSNSGENATLVAAAAAALVLEQEEALPPPSISATVAPPKHRKIQPDQAIMLHMGKAGGGTFDLRSQQWWHVTIQKTCHPWPCLQESFDNINDSDLNHTSVFLSVRDPVDRFVSAFYWRLQLWCRDDDANETRVANSGPPARFPHLYCGYYRPPERQVLFQRYRENANLLAESLCNDDDENVDTFKNSNETMVQAAKDVRVIGHLFANLFDWVGPDWMQKRQTLFPIVLERNFSFESQIDDAMNFLQSRRRRGRRRIGGIDANPADFQARQDYVAYMDRLVKQQQQQKQQKHHEAAQGASVTRRPSDNNSSTTNASTTTSNSESSETTMAAEQILKASHSSSSLQQQQKVRMIPLSARGERCVARYYERDYQIIQDLSLHACKTTTCQNALQSIIRRRKHLLGWE